MEQLTDSQLMTLLTTERYRYRYILYLDVYADTSLKNCLLQEIADSVSELEIEAAGRGVLE